MKKGKKMRIGIDARCLMEGTRTGVEEYTIGFVKRLLEQDSENKYILFFNSFKKIRGEISWLGKYGNVEVRSFGFPNKALNFSMWLFGWPKIDILLGGVDVFFTPNILFAALSKECHSVLTIHDLSFERFPEHFSAKRKLWHFILNPRKLCKRANKILAVSHSTKQDLVGIYGIRRNKIEVVPPLINYTRFLKTDPDKPEKESVRKKYKLPENFILFLGTIEPRKNIISIIKAFEALKRRKNIADSLKLVIAGTLGWSYEEIISVISESEVKEDIIVTGFIKGDDKPVLYHLCKVFVYPSFFEGYGFPPVEAMACGIPVITSNCSSLPEVVRDAALMIDPYRPFDIVLALEILLSDERVYKEYARNGIKRAQELYRSTQKINLLNKLIGSYSLSDKLKF
ncbi:MAG: glycosyltransferase family 1 protein [Patescibacteria group bacterium]|nr:glycosyltransferase family 1 protein [Patescibacteria group bacterium]